MRIVMAATVIAAASLVLAGVMGVAGAETSTTTSTTATPPPRTVSVEGVATEPIEQSANAAAATAVYRQGMADAVSDAQTKAQFLTSKVSATLGQVQSLAEGGGYIECVGSNEYLGEQPDFGTGESFSVAPRAAAKSAPRVVKPAARPGKPKKRKKSSARKADVVTCTLSTQVSLVYALS